MAPQNSNRNTGDGSPSETSLFPNLSWWGAQANPYTGEEMEAASEFARTMIKYMQDKRAEKMAREVEGKGETGGGGGGGEEVHDGEASDVAADPAEEDVKK